LAVGPGLQALAPGPAFRPGRGDVRHLPSRFTGIVVLTLAVARKLLKHDEKPAEAGSRDAPTHKPGMNAGPSAEPEHKGGKSSRVQRRAGAQSRHVKTSAPPENQAARAELLQRV